MNVTMALGKRVNCVKLSETGLKRELSDEQDPTERQVQSILVIDRDERLWKSIVLLT